MLGVREGASQKYTGFISGGRGIVACPALSMAAIGCADGLRAGPPTEGGTQTWLAVPMHYATHGWLNDARGRGTHIDRVRVVQKAAKHRSELMTQDSCGGCRRMADAVEDARAVVALAGLGGMMTAPQRRRSQWARRCFRHAESHQQTDRCGRRRGRHGYESSTHVLHAMAHSRSLVNGAFL